MNPGQSIIGYARRSKASGRTESERLENEQREETSVTAQRQAIERECDHKGWALLDVKTDILSGGNMARPELQAALDLCRNGEAAGIVVAKLDRLSRSVIDFANLLAEAKEGGWNIVALDFGLDLTTPQGELVANVLMAVAQWERKIIGQRTREALQVKREQGVVLGRPSGIDDDLRARIVHMRQAQGLTLRDIAAALNHEGVATAQGGAKWHQSTVAAILKAAA